MIYANRNSFFRAKIKKALQTLMTFNPDLSILDYINERKTPSVSVSINNEKNHSLGIPPGQAPNSQILDTTAFADIILLNRVEGGNDFVKWSDDWLEKIEYALSDIDLQGDEGEQKITIDGSDFYRIKINDIYIDSIQKTEEARGQRLGMLRFNLKIEFNRIYF